MSAETREIITWMLGTLLSLSTLVGLLTRFVLIPYIKEHVVSPMQDVRRQVTENHHTNPVPTVLDRIDDVSQQIKEWGEESRELRRQVDEHMSWSARWVDLIEREIGLLRREREEES